MVIRLKVPEMRRISPLVKRTTNITTNLTIAYKIYLLRGEKICHVIQRFQFVVYKFFDMIQV